MTKTREGKNDVPNTKESRERKREKEAINFVSVAFAPYRLFTNGFPFGAFERSRLHGVFVNTTFHHLSPLPPTPTVRARCHQKRRARGNVLKFNYRTRSGGRAACKSSARARVIKRLDNTTRSKLSNRISFIRKRGNRWRKTRGDEETRRVPSFPQPLSRYGRYAAPTFTSPLSSPSVRPSSFPFRSSPQP